MRGDTADGPPEVHAPYGPHGHARRRVGGWRSAPGSGVPSEARSTTSSGSFASTGRARSGPRVLVTRRRRGSRGHRPGGVSRRRPQSRPLRPPPPVRPVAAPDRGQPRDRLDARPPAARRGRARRLRRRTAGAGARRRRASRGSAISRPSIARWSCSATCSSTRPARSPSCSTCRAAPSTRGSAAASIG